MSRRGLVFQAAITVSVTIYMGCGVAHALRVPYYRPKPLVGSSDDLKEVPNAYSTCVGYCVLGNYS